MHYPQIIINTDGGARSNPGPAAIGITAQAAGQVLFEISEFIGHQTNNVAEYTAVIHALNHLKEHQLQTDHLLFILDSELIVRQINGLYRVKQPHLQTLNGEIQQIIRELKKEGSLTVIEFKHVLRQQNYRADQLVNQALDAAPPSKT